MHNIFVVELKKIVFLAFVLVLLSTAVVTEFTIPVISYPIEIDVLMEVDLPVHNIDSGKNFSTIHEAINDNSTLSGHTIFVDGGTYYEHVVVNKSISLIGENKETTIIDGNSTGTVVYITANNINISGFTIQNSHITPPDGAATPSGSSGIYVDVSIGNNISQNIITKNTFGIFLSGSGNNILSDNIASLNTWDGIHLDESWGNILADNSVSNNGYNGIRLSLSSNGNTLTGNNASSNSGTGIVLSFSTNNNILTGNNAFFNNGTGIRLILSSDNILTDNNVSNNKYGIQLSNSDNNVLTGNNASNNRYNFGVLGDSFSHFNNYVDTSNMVDGKPIYYLIDVANAVYDAQTNAGTIYLINSDNITITDLIFTKNRNGVFFFNTRNSKIENVTASNNVFGIRLDYSDKNTLTSNNASNNVYGIWLSQSGNNTLTFNTVRSNDDAGLRLWVYSSNNTISHNNFLSNNEQVLTHQSTNLWDNGVEGNYWSDYEDRYPDATEIDGSGIWDTPYVIDEDNQDNYPLLHRYGSIRNLDTNLTYLTIQSAIDASETLDGQTIRVDAGTYYEHVTINKSISLIGENRSTTIIDGNETGTIVTITTGNVSISGFTIQHGGFDQSSIYISSSSDVTINDNAISNNFEGIRLNSSNGNDIADNLISPYAGVGIFLEHSNGNVIRGNIINPEIGLDQIGILLTHSTENSIINNTILNNLYDGIKLIWDANANVISGNNIKDNGYGVLMVHSGNNTLYHNNFINNGVSCDDANTWDNGYPSGGNYWSDYEERYPNATEIDDSGLWDTPYFIDESNQDNYPIIPEFSTWTSMLLVFTLLTVVIAIYKRRLLKTSIH